MRPRLFTTITASGSGFDQAEFGCTPIFDPTPTGAMGGHFVKISASAPMPTSRYWLHHPLATSASFTRIASALPGTRFARSSPMMPRTSMRTAAASDASPRQRSSMTRSSIDRT